MLEVIIGIIALFLFLVLVVGGWIIGAYNRFVALKQSIKTQWSNIKTEYQRRFDLFMNLVETVKSYKKHEKGTLIDVIKMRKAVNFVGDKKKQLKNMNFLDDMFSKLAVVVEQYPNLKANEQHNKLIEEIRITEDRINVARTDYNDIVRIYNTTIATFPTSIVANIFRFIEEKFYINEEKTDKAPTVKLD